MPFLPPNQQRQSTEGTTYGYILSIIYRSGERAVSRWGKEGEGRGEKRRKRGSVGKPR